MAEAKPNYYAIIPANIRYDAEITPNAKLLYAEITALSNQQGFCWANNQYFASLYGVSVRTVQRWLEELSRAGHISVNISDGENRTLSIAPPVEIVSRMSCPHDKNVIPPHDKNVTHNITSINNTSNRVYTPHDKKRSYGQYGWVKLTDAEYQRLVDEFGERVISHYITYIDESAQSNGNKNKWKDWNLVIRRAIKGKWGGEPPREEEGYLA
jgi:hypothetical protein